MHYTRLLRAGLRLLASYRLNRQRPERAKANGPCKFAVLSSRHLLGATGAENYAWEQAYETALAKRGIPFETLKECSKTQGKIIFWAPSCHFNLYGFLNHSRPVYCFARQAEDQGNILFPSASDMLYWENKGYMHRRFAELGVPAPDTLLLPSTSDIPYSQLHYPLLFKAEHSSSSDGVIFCGNEGALRRVLENREFSKDETIILQRIVNTTRDMRVTYVGDEILLAFWRIKRAGGAWTSTASKFGSTIDFGNFPEKWRGYIMNECRKFGLRMGGVDVLWENDDLSRPPLFLEVSPIFSPNPMVDLTGKSYTYAQYKKRFRLFDNFQYEQGKAIYAIADRYVGLCLDGLGARAPECACVDCNC
jgi:glutathione synthase/RimK-type ligase-like ATP-grasp enzyme